MKRFLKIFIYFFNDVEKISKKEHKEFYNELYKVSNK